jgi:hypothetical protein
MAQVPLRDGRIRSYASIGYRRWLSLDGHYGVSGAAGVQFFSDPADGNWFWGISIVELDSSQRWFGGEIETTPEGLPRRPWGPPIHGGFRSDSYNGWTIRVETGAALGLPDGFFASVWAIGAGYTWP